MVTLAWGSWGGEGKGLLGDSCCWGGTGRGLVLSGPGQ